QIAIEQTGAQAVEGFDGTTMSDWLLRDVNGQSVPSPRGPNYLFMDVRGDGGWAVYFATYTARVLNDTNADGLILDEIPLRRGSQFKALQKYGTDESLQDATKAFLVDVRHRLSKPVLINAGALSAVRSDGKVLWEVMGDAIDGA